MSGGTDGPDAGPAAGAECQTPKHELEQMKRRAAHLRWFAVEAYNTFCDVHGLSKTGSAREFCIHQFTASLDQCESIWRTKVADQPALAGVAPEPCAPKG
jgi:hypothetical protein